MTEAEFIALVQEKVPDNTEALITPAQLRAVLLALAAAMHAGGFDTE